VFCLFASSELLHDRITRKKDSFNQTISAIAYCKKVGITPELHFVATARNYTQLPDICSIAQSYGVAGISILRFVPQGRGKLLDKAILSKKQNKDLISTIEHLRRVGFTIRTGSPMNVFHINTNPTCFAGVDRLIVAPNFRIYPCDAFKQIQAEEIVNTTKDSIICNNATLSKCWSDSPYLNEVRNVLESEPVGRCNSCIEINTCNTGCLAQKYLVRGVIDKGPDPACIFC
jgi:radical SAM protein with 4Fe4S-binding SPASM domain